VPKPAKLFSPTKEDSAAEFLKHPYTLDSEDLPPASSLETPYKGARCELAIPDDFSGTKEEPKKVEHPHKTRFVKRKVRKALTAGEALVHPHRDDIETAAQKEMQSGVCSSSSRRVRHHRGNEESDPVIVIVIVIAVIIMVVVTITTSSRCSLATILAFQYRRVDRGEESLIQRYSGGVAHCYYNCHY